MKKLFEMPNQSFVDVNYIIKEEENNEIDNNNILIKEKNFFLENINNIKDTKNDLNLMKYPSTSINNDKKVYKNERNFEKKYKTPAFSHKIPSILPKQLQLNPLEEEETNDDLAKKIFSKIFNKFPNDNLNSSIEIVEPNEIFDDNKYKDRKENIVRNYMENYDTFCLALFISGLKPTIDKDSIIENSYSFVSSCGHKNCSILLSFKPELIMTYSNKNSPITQELNYLVANLCFPLGIKICFEIPDENNKDKKNIQKIQNIFYNVIKNAKDDIFYIATMQYFVKMAMKDFKDLYKFDINSYYSEINNLENKDKNLKKVISLINGLKENDIIYLPESISLLSKQPFFRPMNFCLNNIISLPTQEDRNNLINHIINEVPIPQKLKQIQFYIPLYQSPLILNHYYNIFKGLSKSNNSLENNIIDDLSMSQLNSKVLLEKIPIDNIIILFQLLLLEQQILIIENNYLTLSEIIFILISLIYPLVWTNPFLPILSLNTVQFLQTPVPYIMGLDEFLLKYAYNSKNIYIGKEIIMYNLMSKNFILSRTRKKANKKEIVNEFKLNFLPEKIENFMNIELKKLKIILDSNRISDVELDIKIRLVFLKTMICLIGDYNNYTFYKNDDDMPLFNIEAFIESHKERQIKLFYEQMTKTQLFKQFLLNERQLYFYNIRKNINMNKQNNILDENFDINNCVDTSYFKKMIKNFPELINNEEIRKLSLDDDENINKSAELLRFKKSKSNKHIKINFDMKKNITKSYNNPITIKEKKLTIDFNKVSMNSPEIINLTKSHQFNLQGQKENKIDNDLIIKKSVTNKYNNIIIKKTNKIKKYLLYPYFLPKLKKKENKLITQKIINDRILEYNKKNNYTFIQENKKNKIYILEKSLRYNFNQINKKNYYIIEQNNPNYIDENTHNFLTEKYDNPIYETKSSVSNGNQSSQTIPKKTKKSKNHFNKKKEEKKLKIKEEKNNQKIVPKYYLIEKPENSENIELIDKCFKSCYTNKHRVTNEQFSSLEKIFSYSFSKSYFAKLLVPDMRIKNKSQHKQLISTSFEDLKIIMKMCLEKLTHEENEIGRLLTIACFSYYKIDKDKNIFYLYQSFIEGVVYPCKLWLIDEFWMEFFRIEMSEASNKEDELIKNYDNNNYAEFSDNDKSVIEFKSKFTILKENSLYMSKIMYKLNLNQIFIVKVFEKMILPVYECDYYNINNIMKDIFSLFNNN